MTTTDWITLCIGILQFLATSFIAVVVYRQAKALKRVEVQNQAIDAFNLLNSTALASNENLHTFDRLGREQLDEPDSLRRKRWCAFVWLQALQSTYLSMHHNVLDNSFGERALGQQLEVILRDDLVYWLVINRGFHPRFTDYCTEIRLKVAPDKPTDMTEAQACAVGQCANTT